ncbi:MAG TPA: response regulator transcription factor [Chloroflexota bacterium]|jgi:two-component system response regulator DegU|nr:response regulator transcription factor [Chloroflexota bacterium]
MDRTRVMLVDDQRLFRRGARAALARLPDLDIVGETENDDEALGQVVAANPDVVVLGELSGGWDVFAAALRRHLPRVGLAVLLDHVTEEDLFFALKAGACACRPRTIDGATLAEVVRQAARGECVIHMSDVTLRGPSRRLMAQPGMAPEQVPHETTLPCPLSDREMEILAGVAEGCSNKEIGRRYGISDQTVKNHLTTVLRKLNVTDRTEAVVMALRSRWLKLESIKIGHQAA